MRTCVIGAGPCGLAALKHLRQAGCRDVVCYDEHTSIGGNWAYTDDPARASVHDCTRTISSRRLSAYPDFPMPAGYPEFPSHRQMLAYFTAYARHFELLPYVRLGARVRSCRLDADGWTVDSEPFDNLVVCSGHHRDPFLPAYPGTFTGPVLHSSAYKVASSFRGQRVLVVGAGNSGADIAVDVSRVAAYTAISMRHRPRIMPKRILGRPADVVYRFWQGKLPPPLLRRVVGDPTVNDDLRPALRDGRVVVVRGIERYDGQTVHFTGGFTADFDAIVMATGFRVSFPFLPFPVPPLYLNMLHPTIPSLYFIGLFQPLGCIWRLADDQARIAALQITGRQPRPASGAAASGLKVDYRRFERQLRRQAGQSYR